MSAVDPDSSPLSSQHPQLSNRPKFAPQETGYFRSKARYRVSMLAVSLRTKKWAHHLGYIILGIGLLEPFGYMFDWTWAEQMGFITVSSPLPLVFTDREGMEDFASQYTLDWIRKDGSSHHQAITAENFAKISGPFNRRGVYATAIGYAPRLPKFLWERVLRYGFCEKSWLANAMGDSDPFEAFVLTITTQTRGRSDEWKYSVRCSK